MYLSNPSTQAGFDTRSIFKQAKFYRFELRIFASLRLVAIPSLKNPVAIPSLKSALQFTHKWRENS